MTRRRLTVGWLVLLGALLLLRVPSIVQPAGGDQGLYVYEGQRVLAGDVPYRDVWDQKPPGPAFLYAALWTIWPRESVVPLADLAAAAGVAALLIVIGRRRGHPHLGYGAAAIFLFFGDPSASQRLGGVYVRGQCEPFVGLAVAGALALLAGGRRSPARLIATGVLLAGAFWLKYNAAAYGLPVLAAVWAWAPATERNSTANLRAMAWIGAGFAAVGITMLAYFAAAGALHDLRLATIDYNLRYSDETYDGWKSVVVYPFTVLWKRAFVDFLWYLGGLGAALLVITRARTDRSTVVWLSWLAATVLSIAVNGARDLPNYFVQAYPPLAMAAAAGLAAVQVSRAALRLVVAAVILLGVWKVGADTPTFGLRWAGVPSIVSNLRYDLDYWRGGMDRQTYLSRFKGPKFDALAIERLTRRVRDTTSPTDAIYVFGFSGGSVGFKSGRESASRFFWSRPILIEFAADEPGYGSAGLLADLQNRRPVLVALQREQWDSERFFLDNAGLRTWLEDGYVLDEDTPMFSVWRRKS